jgi:prepilin-type N-terminal cleavage/methylation domain-containing protein
MRRRRSGGFTLMEVLIAMALAGIVTASVLALVRTQLQTFEMNDQIMRTQQSVRASMDFVESSVRRACGGVGGANGGNVAVNVPGATQQALPCLQAYSGATINAAGPFTSSSPTTLADALDVVYATGTMTAVQDMTKSSLTSTTPYVYVYDVSQFSAGDYVLVSDYSNAYLFKVSSKNPSTTTRNTAGTLYFGTLSSAVYTPTTAAPGIGNNSPVFKAATYSFYVVTAQSDTGSPTYFQKMLFVDTDGVASTNHKNYGSTTVQPLVEGVVDFQIALGNDADISGTITDTASTADEWLGNNAGDATMSLPPWMTGTKQPRQVRISLVLQTLTQYSGPVPSPIPSGTTGFEDRTTYPTTTSNYNPRYRSMQEVVAPRAWNLSE